MTDPDLLFTAKIRNLTDLRKMNWLFFSFVLFFIKLFWINGKSRLVNLVLLPLWYGNKDIIRDNISKCHR